MNEHSLICRCWDCYLRRAASDTRHGDHGRIVLVPSLFSKLSSVFGRLQTYVLLVMSSKNGKFKNQLKPFDGRLLRL